MLHIISEQSFVSLENKVRSALLTWSLFVQGWMWVAKCWLQIFLDRTFGTEIQKKYLNTGSLYQFSLYIHSNYNNYRGIVTDGKPGLLN